MSRLPHRRRLHACALAALVALVGCGKVERSPDELMASARQYRQSGNMAAAIVELRNVLHHNAGDLDARLLLGQSYLDSGDPWPAEIEFRKVVEVPARKQEALPLLGFSLVMQGQYEKALTEVREKPESAPALTVRGLASAGLRRPADAEKAFARALELTPGYAPAILGQARLLASQGKADDAIGLAGRVLETSPVEFDALLLRGNLEVQRGNSEAALASYDEALKARPGNLTVLFHRASLLTNMGRFEAAQADIDTARRLKPTSPLVDYAQAVLYFRTNKMDRAREMVQRAVKAAPAHLPSALLAAMLDYLSGDPVQAERHMMQAVLDHPDEPFARKLQIATFLRSGQIDRALAALPLALALAPEDPRMLALAGEAYMRARQYGKATEYLLKAAERSPENPDVRSMMGVSRLAARDDERAIADLEAAADLTQTLAQTDTLLVMTYLRRREFDKAVATATKITQKDPRNPVAFYALGGAYLGMGDGAKARKSFEQALEARRDYAPAAMMLARLDLQAKAPDNARARFKAVLDVDPKNIEAMIGLASVDRATGNLAGYATWLESARRADPAAVIPAILLGRHYLAVKDYVKSEGVAASILATNPEHADALALLADVQVARGETMSAVRTYGRLTSVVPLSPDAHNQLGLVRLKTDDYANAAESYRRALRLNPKNVDSLVGLAHAEYGMRRYDEVLRLSKEIQQLSPGSPTGVILEGDALMALDKPARALQAYETAFKARQTDLLAIKIHAAQAAGSDKAAAATARLLEWQRSHPTEIGSRLYLADYYAKSGQGASAIQVYEHVLKLDPRNLLALNNAATLYLKQKDPRALAYLEQSYAVQPASATIADNYGWALVEQGDVARGVEILYKATQLAPENPSIRYHLAVGILKSGERARAREELEKVLNKNVEFPNRSAAVALARELDREPAVTRSR